jgi:hypothetical protein
VTLRHAAALALVGWYLMIPPIESVNRWTDDDLGVKIGEDFFKVQTDFPIHTWSILSSFDSATACQSGILQAQKALRDQSSDVLEIPQKPDLKKKLVVLQLSQALCIASDDPRLKGN